MQRGPSQAQRYGWQHVRSTIARPVLTQSILAFIGRMDAHLVGQHGYISKEVRGANQRLQHGTDLVTVALQLHFFEVKRLVAQADAFHCIALGANDLPAITSVPEPQVIGRFQALPT